jgi:thymidylate synthase (FAD)
MASMCIEIETSRAIAAQILRHRSNSFQEYSQRYSDISLLEEVIEPIELRAKAEINRQSSEEVIDDPVLAGKVELETRRCVDLYHELIDAGVATECARMVLPLATKTRLYMHGTLRSFLHYLDLRLDDHTQKEHREIAFKVLKIIEKRFPSIYKAHFEEKYGEKA